MKAPDMSAMISSYSKPRPSPIAFCMNSINMPNAEDIRAANIILYHFTSLQPCFLCQSSNITSANPPNIMAWATLSAPGNRDGGFSPKGFGARVNQSIIINTMIVNINGGNLLNPFFNLSICLGILPVRTQFH